METIGSMFLLTICTIRMLVMWTCHFSVYRIYNYIRVSAAFSRLFSFSGHHISFFPAYIMVTKSKECVSANEGLHRRKSVRVSTLHHYHQLHGAGGRQKIPGQQVHRPHGVSPGVRSAVFLLYFFPSSFSLIFTHFSNKYSN